MRLTNMQFSGYQLSTYYVLSADTRLLVEQNRTPRGGEDVELWDPSPTAYVSPSKKDFRCSQKHPTGLSVRVWHIGSYFSTTYQGGTHRSQKPGPYVEDDIVVVDERDFRNSSSAAFSF